MTTRKDYGKPHKVLTEKERAKRYYYKHRKDVLERKAKYYKAHRENILKRCADYYEAHREDIIKNLKEEYKGKKKFILSYNIKYLMDHGYYVDGKFYCPECGKEIDITQVHNHHIEPESKLFNISQCSNYGYGKIEKELVKTIPICPQCHKLITAEQKNYHVFKEFNSITNADLIVKFAEYVPGYKRRRQK